MAEITPRPYYVWRRSDGYVSCTKGEPRNGRDTFDILLITDNWPDAYECIKAERDDRHDATVASWT